MNWYNVRLILGRELRDQMRDRRTLFVIVVLPLLLYPLMGMSFVQVAQFLRENQSRVLLVSPEPLPESPPLVVKGNFVDASGNRDERLDVEVSVDTRDSSKSVTNQRLLGGDWDVIVYLPAEFASQLAQYREYIATASEEGALGEASTPPDIPTPEIVYNASKDKSRIAYDRVHRILEDWRGQFVDDALTVNNLPARITTPFDVVGHDVSPPNSARAALWSKVLPFVVLIWALTGAFYPAIDLCAGEKERGTLETLLSSPAERSEIVWGKLLTIMIFSCLTSLLNLLSMCISASLIIRQFAGLAIASPSMNLGPPPMASIGWLVLMLLPLSALFSALALALATMARSTKEGQYYLMPMLLITLPLMMLPMLPSAELDLGTSLIPLTGGMLLLRQLMEGEYRQALPYVIPVTLVTGACCAIAIRWAIDQFNNESVLFRESERWDLGLWLRSLFRDRGPTPTVSEAFLCGILILVMRFFAGFLVPMPDSWSQFAAITALTLVALVATPAVMMALALTTHPTKTLQLHPPLFSTIPAAALLAACCHPIAMAVSEVVKWLYPIQTEALAPLQSLIAEAPNLTSLVLLLALLPAICEELAFRGFVLSGLRHSGSKWRAIAMSSVFFGLAHGIIQQSMMATLVGLVIGYIAVQSDSLWPCITFHFVFNALGITSGSWLAKITEHFPQWEWLFIRMDDSIIYGWPILLSASVFAVGILRWFHGLHFQQTVEERIHEALDHQNMQTVL